MSPRNPPGHGFAPSDDLTEVTSRRPSSCSRSSSGFRRGQAAQGACERSEGPSRHSGASGRVDNPDDSAKIDTTGHRSPPRRGRCGRSRCARVAQQRHTCFSWQRALLDVPRPGGGQGFSPHTRTGPGCPSRGRDGEAISRRGEDKTSAYKGEDGRGASRSRLIEPGSQVGSGRGGVQSAWLLGSDDPSAASPDPFANLRRATTS